MNGIHKKFRRNSKIIHQFYESCGILYSQTGWSREADAAEIFADEPTVYP